MWIKIRDNRRQYKDRAKRERQEGESESGVSFKMNVVGRQPRATNPRMGSGIPGRRGSPTLPKVRPRHSHSPGIEDIAGYRVYGPGLE